MCCGLGRIEDKLTWRGKRCERTAAAGHEHGTEALRNAKAAAGQAGALGPALCGRRLRRTHWMGW